MNLTEAQNTFALRLYEWSQRDFIRELRTGCPLLSLVGLNNRRIAALVAWSQTLSPVEQIRLAKALTMLCHDNARQLNGETITPEIQTWRDVEHIQTTNYMESLPPLASADRSLPTFRPIDFDRCLDTLCVSLSPTILGKPSRRKSLVRCLRKFGDWKLITEFTIERRHRNLYCTFQFVRKDDTSVIPTPEIGPKPFPRSLFLFYGVYNRTVVAVESQSDSEPMSKALVKLAEHFVAQADPLFAGLGIDS